MTTGDDDRREPITADEAIRDYGREYYLAALAYCRHHHDETDQPFWTAEEWDTVVGLIEIEGGRDHDQNPDVRPLPSRRVRSGSLPWPMVRRVSRDRSCWEVANAENPAARHAEKFQGSYHHTKGMASSVCSMNQADKPDTTPWDQKTPEQKANAVTDHLACEWVSGNLRPISEQRAKEEAKQKKDEKSKGGA